MKQRAALLMTVITLMSGCAGFGASYHDPDPGQKKPQEPVDRNRHSVPDSLERQAVPLGAVIDRPVKSPDQ